MDPVKLFTVIVLISLPTVMYGGYALLDLMAKVKLNEFQRTYFRAGHAHAGVLLVMTLATLAVLDGTEFGEGVRWVVCILLAVGVLSPAGCSCTWHRQAERVVEGEYLHLRRSGRAARGVRTTGYGVIIT
jgi:hypothetical protein